MGNWLVQSLPLGHHGHCGRLGMLFFEGHTAKDRGNDVAAVKFLPCVGHLVCIKTTAHIVTTLFTDTGFFLHCVYACDS